MWLIGALCVLGAVVLGSATSYSLETNRVGQPEIVQPLGLPTDEESFNRLSPLPYSSGTHHFVSSTFPEIDSRGFHESVFDGIGDYLPSRPSDYFKYLYKTGEENGYRGLYRKKRSLQSKSKVGKTESRSEESENEKQLENRQSNTEKRSLGGRYVRGMEMGSSGFHGDTFNSGFGDFMTMRKRKVGAYKGNADLTRQIMMQIRKKALDNQAVLGATYKGGFGDFYGAKKSSKGLNQRESGLMSFDGETGEENTMKKRRPEMDSMGFHGDTFGNGFGEFDTMKKRRPEMDSMGFHGDTFGNGFGEFDTMKKRRPEMDSMGFHGDTFGNGFGEFDTMKKRRPEMDSMGFHGDTFGNGFGEFDTMKKRRPEMDSMGFHGDTFGGGFGEFETMKKRRPEMDSMGFHGDTFGNGFGEFDTMKRSHEKDYH
ncbi:uncharacterized protein LOC106667523 isoform X2 [Cimex lectularius]|uniref:Uncharacterized protein n=1 Tax=Cimex lectularius TaxID=79782 RepID=A0A8I6RT07_CIMLE|nr:uncharacterized protein LOC106667523 isoform X2 [Cimex lectularius]